MVSQEMEGCRDFGVACITDCHSYVDWCCKDMEPLSANVHPSNEGTMGWLYVPVGLRHRLIDWWVGRGLTGNSCIFFVLRDGVGQGGVVDELRGGRSRS